MPSPALPLGESPLDREPLAELVELRWPCARRSRARASALSFGPCEMWASRAVVGVMPVGRMGAPSSALMNVDLPWLNSPRTTTVKCSASSLGRRVSRTSRATDGSPAASAARREIGEHAADGRLALVEGGQASVGVVGFVVDGFVDGFVVDGFVVAVTAAP